MSDASDSDAKGGPDGRGGGRGESRGRDPDRDSSRDSSRDDGRDHALGPWQEVSLRTVTDPRAATLLSDPDWVPWIEPFLGRTRSIAEAADELGRPLDAVRYRVRRLHEVGVLEVVGERKRAGRPIRLYRTVADGFVVPFEATPFVDLEERLVATITAQARSFARSAAQLLREGGVEARRIYRAPDGTVHQEAAADDAMLAAAAERDPLESLALEASLPRSVARELLRDMIALAQRAERADVERADLERHDVERTDPGAQASPGPVRRYLLALQIAPVPDADE